MGQESSQLSSQLFNKFIEKSDCGSITLNGVPILLKSTDDQTIYPYSTVKHISYMKSIWRTIKKIIEASSTPYIDLSEKFLEELLDGFFDDLDYSLQKCKDRKIISNIYKINSGDEIEIDTCPNLEIILATMIVCLTNIACMENYIGIYAIISNKIDTGILNIIKKYPEYFDINYELRNKQTLTSIMLNHNAIKTLEYCLKNLPVNLKCNSNLYEDLYAKYHSIKTTFDSHQFSLHGDHLTILEELCNIYHNEFMSNNIYEKYAKNKELESLKMQLENKSKIIDNVMGMVDIDIGMININDT